MLQQRHEAANVLVGLLLYHSDPRGHHRITLKVNVMEIQKTEIYQPLLIVITVINTTKTQILVFFGLVQIFSLFIVMSLL